MIHFITFTNLIITILVALSNNASDDGQVVKFKESDLKSMGLPTIRAQFGITARSYSEAFVKLQGLGVMIHKD